MEIILLQTTETCLLLWECGAKRRDTIRLVKSIQLVQRTLGRFTRWAALQKFPSVGKINDWNGSVFFAAANLYLSVIKMLSAKEIPCSLSQTWGHPFSLWLMLWWFMWRTIFWTRPKSIRHHFKVFSHAGQGFCSCQRNPKLRETIAEMNSVNEQSQAIGLAGSKRCRIPCFKDQAAFFKLRDLMAFLLRSSVVLV